MRIKISEEIEIIEEIGKLMRKNILDLDNTECKKFFLLQDKYTTLDLPPYFTFEKTLTDLNKEIKNVILKKTDLSEAKKLQQINYIVYGNKDGKYAWRKFQLINPLIYISLVNVISNKDNWEIIKERLKDFRCNSAIRCLSIPVLQDLKQSQKASQISEWVDEIEKESIRLALEFDYLYQTDISNCYGSIYTHSISWAIHGKSLAKAKRNDISFCGNMIDQHLQAMSNGQTNGIPEGSILMDFIAEILLAYSDHELYKLVSPQLSNDSFRILRYRDDYRIFVKEPKNGDLIIKALGEILSELSLRLNTAKTATCDEVIFNSIKPDKITYLHSPNIDKLSKLNLHTELLLFYEIGMKYPNCGTIKKGLTKLYEKYEKSGSKYFSGQEIELVSILSNIALSNPSSFPIIAAFVSKAINTISESKKNTVIKNLFRKLNLLPNSGLLEIWLQRITEPNSIQIEYGDIICKKVKDNNIQVFDTSWIKSNKCRSIIDQTQFIDLAILNSIDKVINSDEIRLFHIDYPL